MKTLVSSGLFVLHVLAAILDNTRNADDAALKLKAKVELLVGSLRLLLIVKLL